jgi:AraC-like DNA-binding protein
MQPALSPSPSASTKHRVPALTMRSQLVTPALAYLTRLGLDGHGLLAQLGVPATAATDPETVVSLRTLRAFWDAAASASGDPLFGVHAADYVPQGCCGLLEYVCQSAATLGHALACIAQYGTPVNEMVDHTIEIQGESLVFRHSIAGEPSCLGRHGNECVIATLCSLGRYLSLSPVAPERIWFAHPAPAVRHQLAEELGTHHIDFGAGENGLAASLDRLRAPIVTADRALQAILAEQADTLAARQGGSSRLLGRVRRSIGAQLPQGVPSLSITAKGLGTSPRSLQRRLAAENTTFQRLLDSVREEIARDLVHEPGMTVGNIAFELRYANHSAFLRAFRRWTGMTPGRYRAPPGVYT